MHAIILTTRPNLCRPSVAVLRWRRAGYGSMVFMMFDPVVPVNARHVGDGIGCGHAPGDRTRYQSLRAGTATGCRSPAHAPGSGVRLWRMWSGSFCRRRRSGMNFHIGKIRHQLFGVVIRSLCCTPDGMKVFGLRSGRAGGPSGKPWFVMKWRIELSAFHGEVDEVEERRVPGTCRDAVEQQVHAGHRHFLRGLSSSRL